jgi:hypothetical protein
VVAQANKRKTYSRQTKLKVQRLYLAKALEPREIAAELAIPTQQVYNIVYRYGLAEIRRKNEKKVLARAEDIAAEEGHEFLASVRPQAQEMTEIGFERAREAGDAKEFAFAMKGTQIAYQISRETLGLDVGKSAAAGRIASLAVVFGAPLADRGAAQADAIEVTAQVVAEEDSVELEFAESQEASEPRAVSAPLIGKRTQTLDA